MSESFSVPDDLAGGWSAMLAENAQLQRKNDPLAGPHAAPPPDKRTHALAYGAGPLLEQLATGEGAAGSGGYDVTYGHGKYLPAGSKKPSELTLDQWTTLAGEMRRRGGQSAMGKYQFMPATLVDIRKAMGLRGSEIATPELQDRMGREVLRMSGYDDFLAGKIDAPTFQHRLAGRFASVADADGKSRYNQPIGTTAPQLQALLAQAQAAADTAPEPFDPAQRAWR